VIEFSDSTCSVCGREVAVGMQHVALIRGTYVLWRECPACYLRIEREVAAEKAAAAAKAKERAA
jgi:hypothetical protein